MVNSGFDIKKTSAFVSYSKKGNSRALIIYPPHPRIPRVHLNELGFDEYLQKFAGKVDLLDLTHFFFGSVNCPGRKSKQISGRVDRDFIARLIPKDYDQYVFVLAFPKQTSIALHLAQHLKEEGKRIIFARNIKNSYLSTPVRVRELISFPFVDVVADSFERNIVDLVSGKSIWAIEDIWYKENGRIKKNKRAARPISLKSLPGPLYKHLENKNVQRTFYELSRGCIKHCDYCVHSRQALDVRPIKTVIRDLKYLIKKFNCYHFHFLCTAVNFSRKYVMDLCDAIIASGIPIRWGSYIFFDAIDDEVARKLHEAGCLFVDGGVESPQIGHLNSNKIRDIRNVERNLALLKRNGIKTYVSFMTGGINFKPNEEEEIIKFALRNKENIDYIFLNGFEIHELNIKNIIKNNKGIKVSPKYVLDQGCYDFTEAGSYIERVKKTSKIWQKIKSAVEGRTGIKILHCETPIDPCGSGEAEGPRDWFYMDYQ
ncbi:MAG: radical SAM protein [Candidatus Omnitrophica bacterium]|nr:radical SAM protein [Candidatus Omnitrophota bacterium]